MKSNHIVSCRGVIRFCWRTILLNYVLYVWLHLYYVNLIIDCEKHARYS